MPGPEPIDELAALRDVSARKLAEAIKAYERALLGEGSVRASEAEIVRLIAQTITFSRTLGRLNILAAYDAATGAKSSPAAAILETTRTPFRADVSFDKMLESFASREPRLAIGYESVQQAYSESHVFAVAKSTTLELTMTVQDRLSRAIVTSEGLASTSKAIEEIGDWTSSYAEVVYRTNLSNAYNAGMMLQAKDPDVSAVFVALEFQAIQDSATRPNHAAAHGLVAGTYDPVWQRFTPPLSYQCRCALSPVSRFELSDRGLFRNGQVIPYYPPNFAQAHPDPGFGGAFRV